MEVETTPGVKQENSIGPILKAAREKYNLSVQYVADQLKLKQSTVQALENNDYRELVGLVYIKGYLRSYARLLNIDIEEQLHLLDEVAERQVKLQQNEQKILTSRKKSNEQSTGLWGSLIVLVIVGIIAFIWHHHKKQEEGVVPAVTQIASTASSVVPSNVNSQALEVPNPELTTIPSGIPVTNATQKSTDNAASSSVAEHEAAANTFNNMPKVNTAPLAATQAAAHTEISDKTAPIVAHNATIKPAEKSKIEKLDHGKAVQQDDNEDEVINITDESAGNTNKNPE